MVLILYFDVLRRDAGTRCPFGSSDAVGVSEGGDLFPPFKLTTLGRFPGTSRFQARVRRSRPRCRVIAPTIR